MIVVLSVAVGMVLWVVLWGLGAKGFDASCCSCSSCSVAATAKAISGYLPGNRDPSEAAPDAAPFTTEVSSARLRCGGPLRSESAPV